MPVLCHDLEIVQITLINRHLNVRGLFKSMELQYFIDCTKTDYSPYTFKVL